MNLYALKEEKDLRTLKNRIEHELVKRGIDPDCCLTFFFVSEALDSIESVGAAESSYEMSLPSELPNRNWCKGDKCPGCNGHHC